MTRKEVVKTRLCLKNKDMTPDYLEFCVLVNNFGKREALSKYISKRTKDLGYAIVSANNVRKSLGFDLNEINVFGFNGYFWEEIELMTEEYTVVYPMFSKAS